MSAFLHNRVKTTRGRVLVIGAGVSGLTTGLCLSRKGFDVTLTADRFAPEVTSVVAGALWEWPPAVCGHTYDPSFLAHSKNWCETSYAIFGELARQRAGVFLRPVTFYFKRAIADDEQQRLKMTELAAKVQQFRHDSALIRENGVNPGLGLVDAYTHLAPMVDTDVYMRWLLAEVRRAGCLVIKRKITGPLREQEEALEREYGADVIVNCAGLGARELAEEAVYPVRGALVRVRNDGRIVPKVTAAHCVSHEGSSTEPGFLFILPRGDDRLLLGGLAEPNEWELNIGLHNSQAVQLMYQRCLEFLPALRGVEIDAAEPVRVGLRPFRNLGVRLEAEPDTRIVHNYGHGGSGVTLSWGCSLEVAELVEKTFLESRCGSAPVP